VVHDPAVTGIVLLDLRRERLATIVHWTNHPEALAAKTPDLAPTTLRPSIRPSMASKGALLYSERAIGGMQSPLGATFNDPRTGQPPAKDSARFAEVVADAAIDVLRERQRMPGMTMLDSVEYREVSMRVPVTNQNFLGAAKAGLFKSNKPIPADGVMESPVGYLRLGAGGNLLLEARWCPGSCIPNSPWVASSATPRQISPSC